MRYTTWVEVKGVRLGTINPIKKSLLVLLLLHSSLGLASLEVLSVNLESLPLHVCQQFSERAPVLHVESQIVAHLLLLRLQLLKLQAQRLSQEVQDLSVEATVLHPVGDELFGHMH